MPLRKGKISTQTGPPRHRRAAQILAAASSHRRLPRPLNNPREMLAPPEGGPMPPARISLEDPVPAVTI